MKRHIIQAVVLLSLLPLFTSAQNNSELVNVMIGTNGMGHTFPGACYPYGAVQLSPDTDTIPHNVNGVYQPRAYDYCAGYQYRDKTIVGFSHTHFSGTGHSDLGDILIMPYSGETHLNPGTANNPDSGYRQRFRHETEIAHPGYYEVTLDDDNIRCQFSVTQHVGAHRYTFQKGDAQKIILDLNHAIYNYDGKILWAQANVNTDENMIVGYRITSGWSRVNHTYFAIKCSKKIKHFGCHDFVPQQYHGFWDRFDAEHDFPEMAGRKLSCWFEFEDDANEVLELYVGLSATSIEGAINNLNAEINDFETIRQNAENAWNDRLSIIECEGSNDAKAMIYTSLYHTLINPSLYQDVDGNYRGIDQNVHNTNGEFTNYTVFSLWDTYRAFHPLLTLLDTALTRNITKSFLAHWQQSPHKMLPVWSHNGSENWCMIGYHGVSVLADALAKGINKEELSTTGLRAMITTSNNSYYSNTDTYKSMGYIPIEMNRSAVSVVLENAYEDWTIYNTLENIKPNNPLSEAYFQRSMSYRNVFDLSLGLVRGMHADGTWKTPYSPLSTSGEGLIEGNALNYSFYAPHDVNGLMAIMDGDKKFIARLDSLFTMYLPDEFFAETEDVTREGMLGGYVQGNEPSHHIPFLYMWTSEPWKTQYWMREIMNKMYRNNMDGLCGNDDCGQMSAWYIFGAMGFYPVCPGTGEYVFGAPYVPYMKVTLGNGKNLEIVAPKVSDKNRYIQEIRWNGKTYTKSFITHEELMNGGKLEFVMSSKPNKKLFQNKDEKPYSLSE